MVSILRTVRRAFRVLPPSPVVISIRYSVLLSGVAPFRLGEADDYKARLYDPRRLAARAELFERIALPSLIDMKPDPRTRVVVSVSDDFPEPFNSRLEAALAPYPWARIKHVAPGSAVINHDAHVREFLTELDALDEPHVHVRFDDDDALPIDYLSRVRAVAVRANEGAAVTMPRGYFAVIETDPLRIVRFGRRRAPMHAQGLAMIGGRQTGNVFALGHHAHVYRVTRVIRLNRDAGFVRSIHAASDSGRRFDGREVDPARVVARFPSLAPLVSQPS